MQSREYRCTSLIPTPTLCQHKIAYSIRTVKVGLVVWLGVTQIHTWNGM